MDPLFAERVAATVPKETLFLHVYFPGDHGGMLELPDKQMFMVYSTGYSRSASMWGSLSPDGGETWEESRSLLDVDGQEISGTSPTLIRLKSERIGLFYSTTGWDGSGPDVLSGAELRKRDSAGAWFVSSGDEGQTWSKPTRVSEPGVDAIPMHDSAIVTSRGRIVAPVYHYVGQRNMVPEDPGKSVALAGDKWVRIGGHDFENCMDFSWVYFSDDEGKSWERNQDGTMIVTLDYSAGGHYSCEESAVAEVSPDHLLLIHRTPMGRLYQSWSSDDGTTWSLPEPTSLAASRAPANLKRIPGTDDLLIIWSQASAEEISMGHHRHRLSAAVSHDGGVTWQHHRNVRAPESDTTTRVDVPPIQYYRSLRHASRRRTDGRQPYSSYPATAFWEDRVIITFYSPGPDSPEGKRGVCMGLPLSWFYSP